MENVEDIQQLIDEKLELAVEIEEKLDDLMHIDGARKAKQFVNKEVKFLKKVNKCEIY